MDLNVEYVLNEILKKLSVEERIFDFNFASTVSFNGKTLIHEAENGKKLRKTYSAVSLQNQNLFVCDSNNLNKTYDSNTDSKKLNKECSLIYNSSGFEDLSATKIICDDSINKSISEKSHLIVKSKEFDLEISHINESIAQNSIEVPQILTSTPKNLRKKYKKFDSPGDEFISNDADDSINEWSAKEKDNDFLNITIDQAIRKYEEKEHLKNVSVQTDSNELLTFFCNCVKPKLKKDKNILFNASLDSPPLKKFRNEDTLNRSSLHEEKVIKIINFDAENDESKAFCITKTAEKIKNKPPISVSTLISVGKENFGFSKTPRIRVGLSKRIKPKKLNNL